MKMRLGFLIACLMAGAVVSTAARAAPYDLTTDYSNTANPNGDWSYTYSGNPLAHQAAPGTVNPLNPAIPAGGFFGTGNDLNQNTPFVLKAAVNGSSAGGTDNDFLAGDVLIHSPNDGTALTIQWTAPSAGTITDLAASVWYAHSSVTRSNDVTLSLASAVLGAWTVSTADNTGRADQGSYANAGPLAVNAGDLLTLSFAKTALQSFGSLNGVAMSFDFTASAVTPIPAALPLFISALVGLGWFGRRGRSQAV
jgi:hypothetical protein